MDSIADRHAGSRRVSDWCSEGYAITRDTVSKPSMRHATPGIMLQHYAQTDMEELIAAQELMLDAIFRHATGAVQ